MIDNANELIFYIALQTICVLNLMRFMVHSR